MTEGRYECNTSILHKLQYGGVIVFPIYYDSKICGRATIAQEGLYFRITCKCDIPDKRPCSVVLESPEMSISLGTCIRMNNQYIINTKVPCKRIKSDNLQFRLVKNCDDGGEIFIPVRENVPFPYLHKLHQARMCYKSGHIGILFK